MGALGPRKLTIKHDQNPRLCPRLPRMVCLFLIGPENQYMVDTNGLDETKKGHHSIIAEGIKRIQISFFQLAQKTGLLYQHEQKLFSPTSTFCKCRRLIPASLESGKRDGKFVRPKEYESTGSTDLLQESY